MRIARIELDGIGPFDHAVFEFPPPPEGTQGELFLFEGPNGSGKTTLAVTIATALGPFPSNEYLKAPFLWPKRAHGEDACAEMILSHKGKSARIELDSFTRTGLAMIDPPSSMVAQQIDDFFGTRFPRIGIDTDNLTTSWAAFAFASHQQTPISNVPGPGRLPWEPLLRRALLFGVFDSTSWAGVPGAPLGQFLANLDYDRVRAIAYAQDPLRQEERVALDATASAQTQAIKRMETAFSRVLDCRVEFRFQIGDPSPRILFDGAEVPLDLLGEGLRSTLAWLADLFVMLELTPWTDRTRSPFDQHFWLILDEVDQSLHPKLQMRLFPTLRELFPNACIYATTHSPFVVASVGEGYVFSLDPAPGTRRVSGPQKARRLEQGQTLERIVMEVFETPFTFLEPETRRNLAEHDAAVKKLRAGGAIDWTRFREVRRWLLQQSDEVRTVVAMREVPVRAQIQTGLVEAEP